MTETVQPFEADVSRVLDLVINSLYKEREIFLRELISNASDACDKLRYQSLAQPELLGDDPELKIRILADETEGLLTVSDNGIGMSREDLVENLGTIARSGTSAIPAAAVGPAGPRHKADRAVRRRLLLGVHGGGPGGGAEPQGGRGARAGCGPRTAAAAIRSRKHPASCRVARRSRCT